MRAETTIKAVESIAKVSRKGKRINGLFRLLGNPEVLWKQAYINLYTNKGAVTKGTTSNTLDGFSMDRVNHLIRLLYAKEYHLNQLGVHTFPKRMENGALLAFPPEMTSWYRRLSEFFWNRSMSLCFHGILMSLDPKGAAIPLLCKQKINGTGSSG